MHARASFVVRLWETGQQSAGQEKSEWRGVVIHVTSGERTAIRSLEEVVEVIARYLELQSAEVCE